VKLAAGRSGARAAQVEGFAGWRHADAARSVRDHRNLPEISAMIRRLAAAAVALSLLAVGTPAGSAAPENWDGLTKVAAKRLDAVYLLPGADFRAYTKVMLDPTEVAFQKNWLRDYNQQTAFSTRMSDADAQRLLDQVRTGFEQVFKQVYTSAGYPITTTPGADVLRVRTAVVNLSVVAPDVMSAGRSRTFSREAGGATVVLEVRDSLTGALLGRAVDSQSVGDNGSFLRNSVTNRSDFQRVFTRWAQISVDGLAELKERSPIGEATSAAATVAQ
jgi:hypothetical protein